MLTVGAIGPDDKPTFFSSESAAVDLAAPGIGILTAVPAAFDPDKNGDGFAVVAGTSFSAPMVSAAVAWVRAARPELTPFQAAQVVRLGARDVGGRGYENATGFGVLSLPGALGRRPPRRRPAGAQRRHPLRRRPRVPASPRRRSSPAGSVRLDRDRRRRRGPGRRLPRQGPRRAARRGSRSRRASATRTCSCSAARRGACARAARSRARRAAGRAHGLGHGPQPRPQDDDVLRRRRVQHAQGPQAAQRELHAARRLSARALGRAAGSWWNHCSSARSPVPSSAGRRRDVRVVAQVPLGVERRLTALSRRP